LSPPLELSSRDLGKAFRFCRKNANLTQQVVADRSGFDPSYISLLERGKINNPTLVTLMRLAEALGVTGSHILALAEVYAAGRSEVRSRRQPARRQH
jgi:transcriptional regulator with XRE-family HTH domain